MKKIILCIIVSILALSILGCNSEKSTEREVPINNKKKVTEHNIENMKIHKTQNTNDTEKIVTNALEVDMSLKEKGFAEKDKANTDMTKDNKKVSLNEPTSSTTKSKDTQSTPSRDTKPTSSKDTTKPIISGANNKTIEYGSNIDLKSGVTAKDNIDGNITSKINISGSVDNKKAGVYKITYTVSDKAGNKTTAVRTITVKPYDGKDDPSGRDKALENSILKNGLFLKRNGNYQSVPGEKVPVFDSYFNKLVNDSMSASKVMSSLKSMSWIEQNHTTSEPNSPWNYAVLKVNAYKFTTSETSRENIIRELQYNMDTGGEYSNVNAYWNNDTKKYIVSAITIELE